MKIWHLLSNRWNSAITEYALSAARALELQGHTCTFTALAESPADQRAAKYLKTRPVPRFALTELRTLRAIAADVQADVIVTYGGPETFLSKALRNISYARIVRFRGQAVTNDGVLSCARQRIAHAHVDLVIAPSVRLAEQLAEMFPETPCASVQLGVDGDVFRRCPPAQWPTAVPELIVLGRLDPVKGHEFILQAMAGLLQSWGAREPRPRLHIVGEPANMSVMHLQGLVQAAGLDPERDVRITAARVLDLELLLSNAALGVVPSLDSEIICRVAEEFLLCGTPVVVSGVGSLDEVLAFPDAGGTWSRASTREAQRVLLEWLERSLAESEATKRQRADRAAELFSLHAMGRALDAVLA